MSAPLQLVLLGHGKTGSLVEEVARQRGHKVRIITADNNPGGSGITKDSMQGMDAVIDFTTPLAVIPNITACAMAGVNMIVGTTGWYNHIATVETLVKESNIGFVWGSNFSIGVNLFFQIAQASATAQKHGYTIRVAEKHHIHKKDAPSGTAVTIQKLLTANGGDAPIESIREGETVGTHIILVDGEDDTMMLVHDAKSRRGFALGAVRAAEWVAGKHGFYEFKDIFTQLT
jgi:4-hydroxy-tetrahydrodipicolinate reductase